MKTIKIERVPYKDGSRLLLRFNYDREIVALLKNIDGRWSKTFNSWYIPDKTSAVSDLFRVFKGKVYVDYSLIKKAQVREEKKLQPIASEGLGEDVLEKINEFRLWMEHRRYSESTVKNYISSLRNFLKFTGVKPLSEISEEDVMKYVNEYIIPNELSYTFQNLAINALKLFYGHVYRTSLDIGKLERPRSEHKLPNVLSKEEVKRILTASTNLKHRTMLGLIYACGLRRSELLNLKPADVDSRRNLLIVRQGKGKKDRIVPLSQKILSSLRDYYKVFRPVTWLFEGQQPGTMYSEKSLESVLKHALKRARIGKPVTLHWLRHSYATHLLESGTDLRLIQELLGHKSSKTTEIYTHVSTKSIQNIKSPFDDIEM